VIPIQREFGIRKRKRGFVGWFWVVYLLGKQPDIKIGIAFKKEGYDELGSVHLFTMTTDKRNAIFARS
jgi:hypothetical protein